MTHNHTRYRGTKSVERIQKGESEGLLECIVKDCRETRQYESHIYKRESTALRPVNEITANQIRTKLYLVYTYREKRI